MSRFEAAPLIALIAAKETNYGAETAGQTPGRCSADRGDEWPPISRRVIAWAASNKMKRDLAIRALNSAISLRRPPKGCIHHTDRGSQYRSHDYQKRLREHGFRVSMSDTGNCDDNTAVETFFKTIKAELLWQRSWRTRRGAEMAIFEYFKPTQTWSRE